jgi:hypothetical protein
MTNTGYQKILGCRQAPSYMVLKFMYGVLSVQQELLDQLGLKTFVLLHIPSFALLSCHFYFSTYADQSAHYFFNN